MATWVRQGTGTAPTSFNLDLIGNYALDNATAPGDFDPAGVTSVRCQWTITGSGFVDDSWNNVAGCALDTGGTELSQHPGEGSTNNQNVARSTDHTDSTGIPTGLSTAQWEAALVRGDGTLDAWCFWNKVKSADGSTLTVSSLTVTITYTPSVAGPQTIAVDATAESESARPQSIGLSVIYVEESEVHTVWLSVGAALETEAAETVAPTQQAAGQSVQVGSTAETESAQVVSVAPGVTTVPIGVATEIEASQIATTAPGPVTVTAGVVSETEAVQVVTVQTTTSVVVTAASETEAAQSITPILSGGAQSIPVVYAEEFEVHTAWISVDTADETETAQIVSPVLVGSPQTVAVVYAIEQESETRFSAAVEVETAQTVTPVLGAGSQPVAVGAASESEAAQGVSGIFGVVSISVVTVVETEESRAVNPSQAGAPQSRPVVAVTETEVAQPIAIDSPTILAIGVVSETEAGEAVGALAIIAVLVEAAAESETAQAVGMIPGATTVPVVAAVELETARPINANQLGAPQTVVVDVATETETAQTITFTGVSSISVGAATETEAVQAVGFIPGATSITVGAVTEIETARSVAPIVGAQYDMVVTHGGPTNNWRTGGLKGRWSTGTLSKRGYTHGPIKT